MLKKIWTKMVGSMNRPDKKKSMKKEPTKTPLLDKLDNDVSTLVKIIGDSRFERDMDMAEDVLGKRKENRPKLTISIT